MSMKQTASNDNVPATKRAGRALASTLTVADDIQPMQFGRIVAVGLYPDRVIVMHRPAGAPDAVLSINKLTLLMTLKGLPVGTHPVDMTLQFPGKGKLQSQGASVKADRADASFNLVMAFAPFLVPNTGEYKLRASVAGRVAEQSFWIVARDLSRELPGLAAPPLPFRLDADALKTTSAPARASAGKGSARRRKVPSKSQ